MIEKIDAILSLPEEEQRLYQIARRYGIVEEYSHMSMLSQDQISRFRSIIRQNESPEAWESYLSSVSPEICIEKYESMNIQ